MQHTRRAGSNILVVRGGKALLLRRINTGWDDGMLIMPGGHLEEGETARQTAVREIQEELGLTIEPERLHLFTIGNVRTNHEYIVHEFVMELREGEELMNNEPGKCSELVWCDPANLPQDVSEVFRFIIEQGYVGRRPYLEFGYDK
jgi:ADP-ribose pyrophosphatase YjhB (NUDIX family)